MGTRIKNDENSEREITLYEKVPEIIQDYIADKRPAETDEQGQSPLLTKGDQKISPSTLQKISYKWTRPCMVGIDCPHDRDPEDCEAAQKNNSASKCPSSRAPHHIRKGYITDQKTEVFRGMQSNTAVTFQTAFKTSTMTFLMTPKSVNATKMNFGTQTKILILATITSENDLLLQQGTEAESCFPTQLPWTTDPGDRDAMR